MQEATETKKANLIWKCQGPRRAGLKLETSWTGWTDRHKRCLCVQKSSRLPVLAAQSDEMFATLPSESRQRRMVLRGELESSLGLRCPIRRTWSYQTWTSESSS